MAKWNTGDKNGMWKDGRTLASNGYVLIRVGIDHPLADVRGYAYEHRLVAEEKLGRPLQDGEVVHHVDHDKTNNAPANLIIVPSNSEHQKLFHPPHNKRENPLIYCACGCGTQMTKYNRSQERRYISGHNRPAHPRPKLTEDNVREIRDLASTGATHKSIAHQFGVSQSHVTRIVNGSARKAG